MKLSSRAWRPALVVLGLSLIAGATGAQIADYPFRKTRFGTGEGTTKVLLNLSDAEMKKVMQKMSDDIGVKCGYCHDEKDYKSEAKPDKDFSRKKLYLVDWLNDKYRPPKATWKYSCYTCHRGKVKPVPSEPPGKPPGR